MFLETFGTELSGKGRQRQYGCPALAEPIDILKTRIKAFQESRARLWLSRSNGGLAHRWNKCPEITEEMLRSFEAPQLIYPVVLPDVPKVDTRRMYNSHWTDILHRQDFPEEVGLVFVSDVTFCPYRKSFLEYDFGVEYYRDFLDRDLPEPELATLVYSQQFGVWDEYEGPGDEGDHRKSKKKNKRFMDPWAADQLLSDVW